MYLRSNMCLAPNEMGYRCFSGVLSYFILFSYLLFNLYPPFHFGPFAWSYVCFYFIWWNIYLSISQVISRYSYARKPGFLGLFFFFFFFPPKYAWGWADLSGFACPPLLYGYRSGSM
jgi:hypothetical protein